MKSQVHRRNGCASRVGDSVSNLDQFGENFKMNIDENGKTSQTTILGSITTLLIYLIVIVYASQRFLVMAERGRVDIVAATEENYFMDTDVFSVDEGLMFAVGFSNPKSYL